MSEVFVSGNWRRLSAYMIDRMLLSLLWLPAGLVAISSWISSRGREVEVPWSWLVVCFFLQFCYRLFFLQLVGGTPGKLLLGLRVVPRGNPAKALDWGQSFLRVMADHLSFFFGPGLFMLALLRFDRTHVSDWVAETRVVQLLPRLSPPRRHVFWGLFLCLYFSVTGFMSVYRLVQMSEISPSSVKIYRPLPTED